MMVLIIRLIEINMIDKLKPIEKEFWNEYIKQNSIELAENVFVEANPAGSLEITDDLIDLYLAGKKSAGSSLVEDFETCGDPLPKVGNFWILLNSKEEPVMILKTVRIEINKFKDIPVRIAIAEGEGDSSLAYWKEVHSRLYSPYLKQWGVDDINEAHVITEFFEIVHRGC